MYLTKDETSISPNLKVDCVNLFLKDIIVTASMAHIMFYDWFLFKFKKKLRETDFVSLSFTYYPILTIAKKQERSFWIEIQILRAHLNCIKLNLERKSIPKNELTNWLLIQIFMNRGPSGPLYILLTESKLS